MRAIDQSVRKKIYIIRELYFRGEEKHGEKRDERQIERERERKIYDKRGDQS